MQYLKNDISSETLWRAIILFGRNVASYKFALGRALLALAAEGKTFITLEELAPHFVAPLCHHLAQGSRQGTFQNSRFLAACRQFNAGDLSQEQLIDETVRLGFKNVIDAFHIVNQGNTPSRFFLDERATRSGLLLTDELLGLPASVQGGNFGSEIEARWRLVETAWDLGLSPRLLTVSYEEGTEEIVFRDAHSRIDISSCRNVLNGYQKGRCFYSGDAISVDSRAARFCDIDHFFPHSLRQQPEFAAYNINGVWNLVLASQDCNRGKGGKFARLPSLRMLERLHTRNEYFIASHHPLRETIINQTGSTSDTRRRFLLGVWDMARAVLIHQWDPFQED